MSDLIRYWIVLICFHYSLRNEYFCFSFLLQKFDISILFISLYDRFHKEGLETITRLSRATSKSRISFTSRINQDARGCLFFTGMSVTRVSECYTCAACNLDHVSAWASDASKVDLSEFCICSKLAKSSELVMEREGTYGQVDHRAIRSYLLLMVACLPRRWAVPSASRLIAPYARSDRELRPGWMVGGFLVVEPAESSRFLRKWVNLNHLNCGRKIWLPIVSVTIYCIKMCKK